jgi:hypothetical protein
MKAVRFVPTRYLVIRNVTRAGLGPLLDGLIELLQVVRVRLLKETTGMAWLADRTVIFECEHAVPGRTISRHGIHILFSAARTGGAISTSRTLKDK